MSERVTLHCLNCGSPVLEIQGLAAPAPPESASAESPPQRLLSADELASTLGQGITTARELMRGPLKHAVVYIGRRPMVRTDELDRWVESQTGLRD